MANFELAHEERDAGSAIVAEYASCLANVFKGDYHKFPLNSRGK